MEALTHTHTFYEGLSSEQQPALGHSIAACVGMNGVMRQAGVNSCHWSDKLTDMDTHTSIANCKVQCLARDDCKAVYVYTPTGGTPSCVGMRARCKPNSNACTNPISWCGYNKSPASGQHTPGAATVGTPMALLFCAMFSIPASAMSSKARNTQCTCESIDKQLNGWLQP